MKSLIIIPCFNEEKSIERLVYKLFDELPNFDILVVDDCSTDNSYGIAKKITKTISLSENLGIGGAVQTGIIYAELNQYDLCIQIDGDGQHLPSEVKKLVTEYKKSGASLIIGSRFISQVGFQSSFARRMGINLISFFQSILFGLNIKDSTSGMRLMDRSAISFFAKNYPLDFPEPISAVELHLNGNQISEIPVMMQEREFGESSIYFLKSIFYMIKVITFIILLKIP